MKKFKVSAERRAKIREFIEQRRHIRLLTESTNNRHIEENVVVMHNDRLIQIPKKYVRTDR